MKKMLVLVAMAALFTTAASAQTTTTPAAQHQGMHHGQGMGMGMGHEKMPPEQRAEKMSQRLTQQLSLSADQTTKVQAILLAQGQEMDAIHTKYAASTDRKAAMPEMKASREKYETQLKGVLTAEQYTKYDQMRDERMQKNKSKMKDGKMKMKHDKMKMKAQS
ncbi:hypothetical protein PK28_06700 [Hymenobacter sp. DG25B]|uniref:hypothetical protein n=1 Tax=Hymenobacter sp. DG25B TaxID=1385664 RepID=UPI0005407F67|nr:hypothetical protein [Hymenobacter sp. DG25B]AIZ63457.1 hypothetical protein PK28_06700 [Hymenobacter sp. DG25B]